MQLKIKPSYWSVSYRKRSSPKQYCYTAIGNSLLDVYEQHLKNPIYDKTEVVGIIEIQSYKEY